jgi:hypothetical protein
MNTVRTKDLEEMFNRIINKLEQLDIKEIDIQTDLYTVITADQWEKFEKAETVVGSLDDDIENLLLMINDTERPCTFVDFDRTASVLRAISQRINPI